jgi:ribonuclease P protein component
MKRNLTKKERLKGKKDIQRIFEEGKSFSCSGAKLICKENDLEYVRFAICLPRRYKNSVQRNRTKRVCREVFRNVKHNIQKGYDIIFVAFPENGGWSDRRRQFSCLLERAGLNMQDMRS